MSKRLFVVEVSARWDDEVVVYAEDANEARRIAADNADPDFVNGDVDTGTVAVVETDNDLPVRYKRTDYPAGGHRERTIGELLHPEPPEPDPTEPPQTYHCRTNHTPTWLPVQGWRVMHDFVGMTDVHWFLHRAIHGGPDGSAVQGTDWTISEAVTGMTGGPFHNCATKVEAGEKFRRFFAERPECVAILRDAIAKTQGTERESPGYPGKVAG